MTIILHIAKTKVYVHVAKDVRGRLDIAVSPQRQRRDAEWKESEHPRGQPGNPGQFGSSGSSSSESEWEGEHGSIAKLTEKEIPETDIEDLGFEIDESDPFDRVRPSDPNDPHNVGLSIGKSKKGAKERYKALTNERDQLPLGRGNRTEEQNSRYEEIEREINELWKEMYPEDVEEQPGGRYLVGVSVASKTKKVAVNADNRREAISKAVAIERAEAANRGMQELGVDPELGNIINDAFPGSNRRMGLYSARVAAKRLPGSMSSKYLSPGEASQIIAYSGFAYDKVNTMLRTNQVHPAVDKLKDAINHSLEKLPASPGTTYRVAHLSPTVAAEYQPGRVLTERGFTSTTKKQGHVPASQEKGSGQYEFVIHGKTGRDVEELAAKPEYGDQEVLFKSGTRFKIKSVEGQRIELEEVGDDASHVVSSEDKKLLDKNISKLRKKHAKGPE